MEATVLPQSVKAITEFKKDKNDGSSSTTADQLNSVEGEHDASNSPNLPGNPRTPDQVDPSSAEVLENHYTDDDGNQVSENSEYQLVLYDPAVNGENAPDPVNESPVKRFYPFSDHTPRVLPAVGDFTIQCANCFKWRLIPTKEKYEEIREHIVEQPFFCETAREWRPSVSCDDEPDLTQDGSRLWAIDKPNIAQPPPGWERLLRIRGEKSTKFADVYYTAPSGKRLRSMVEIQKYLDKHPEFMEEGVSLSKFSFQTPKPLQENYLRKRRAPAHPYDSTDVEMIRYLPPPEVTPVSWSSPDVDTDLQLSRPELSNNSHITPPDLNPETQLAKKGKRTPSNWSCNDGLANYHHNDVNVEEPHLF